MLGLFEPDALYGDEDYNVAVWAQRIRYAQAAIPTILMGSGINSPALAAKWKDFAPALSGILAGGQYPWLTQTIVTEGQEAVSLAFAGWELKMARAIYWFIIPTAQFMVAFAILDTWQYFWHRAMHLNKWLYGMF